MGATQPVAIATGAAFFFLTIAGNSFFARRAVMSYSGRQEPKFPSPVDGESQAPR
jgi:hypothetical protein